MRCHSSSSHSLRSLIGCDMRASCSERWSAAGASGGGCGQVDAAEKVHSGSADASLFQVPAAAFAFFPRGTARRLGTEKGGGFRVPCGASGSTLVPQHLEFPPLGKSQCPLTIPIAKCHQTIPAKKERELLSQSGRRGQRKNRRFSVLPALGPGAARVGGGCLYLQELAQEGEGEAGRRGQAWYWGKCKGRSPVSATNTFKKEHTF